jgi:hypothetical protein
VASALQAFAGKFVKGAGEQKGKCAAFASALLFGEVEEIGERSKERKKKGKFLRVRACTTSGPTAAHMHARDVHRPSGRGTSGTS